MPTLSDHLRGRQPSDIRIAGIKYAARRDGTSAINVAIGNVSLPMHPAMIERLQKLGAAGSPFADGVVKYTGTVGTDEARQAFLNVIASSGCPTEGLHCQITDGGSQAMELLILATCGRADGRERPLLLIDAAYTNYVAFAKRLRIPIVSIARTLGDDGKFSLPPLADIERLIREHRPGALVVIPYDNPTGHFYDLDTMRSLARLCVTHDLWMISDEAYRELFYTGRPTSSVWALGEREVPGITGRRVSIETASKVWNACGLRIGGLVTDSLELHTQCVAENTASLCSNSIGQYIFGALAQQSHDDLRHWYERQRSYYRAMMQSFAASMHQALPQVIVSSPDAALYSVVDVRNYAKAGFDALEFALWCASDGAVEIDGEKLTLLVAPMGGFYNCAADQPNPGKTQLRIAYVEPPPQMQKVPRVLAELLRQYEEKRSEATVSREVPVAP
jgi:aspartate aminotransferase